eukprot:scaffold846_cov252-Pinguiococcus_pyrenoidosus.AAC.38
MPSGGAVVRLLGMSLVAAKLCNHTSFGWCNTTGITTPRLRGQAQKSMPRKASLLLRCACLQVSGAPRATLRACTSWESQAPRCWRTGARRARTGAMRARTGAMRAR